MFRKIFLVILAMTTVFAGSVYAVGLGEIESKSALNQALSAEITLLSAGELAEHEIKATMASQAEFEKLGIDKPFFLNNIKFTTYRKDNGQLAIKLTSREAIKEPFLNFVVELNWPNGRLLREYTILLDPPVYQDSGGSTQSRATTTSTQSSPSKSSRTAEPSAPPVRYGRTQSKAPTITGTTYGPVKDADTLWSIATRARPDSSVSIHQTLVAIYRANKDAFANGNINNLMKGKVLTIPDVETIRSVPHRAALQDVVMQNRQWHSGGARRVVDRTGTVASSSATSDAGGRLSLSTATESDNASGYGSDTGSAELSDIKRKLTETEEAAATLQAENEELRSRLADALKKLEDMQSGGAVNVQDAELAALSHQQELTETDEQSTTGTETAQSGASAEQSDVADSLSKQGTEDPDQSLETTETEGQATETTSDIAANETGEAAPSQTNETADTQSHPVNQPPADPMSVYPEPVKEKGFFEGLLDNGLMLGGGIALIALIAIGVFWQKRKRMEEEAFQDDLVASAGAGSMDTTETFELPEVGDDMLVELEMDDEKSGDSATDEEFDPLGEADIYIAYGKFEEAENLLLDAIEESPARSDLKVKLMECYAEQDNREKFEALAGEVADAPDADQWSSQIEELRSQHWEGGADEESDEFDLPSTEDIFGDESSDDSLDDFSFEEESVAEPSTTLDSLDGEFEESSDDEIALDFDETQDDTVFDSLDEDALDGDLLSDDSLDLDESALEETDAASGTDDDFSLDDESLGSLDEDIDFESADDISLDMDDDEFGFDEEGEDDLGGPITEEGDEVSTKLDLARAYIDMGDADGAKEILNEVVAEGNDAQKSEAQSLLDKLDE